MALAAAAMLVGSPAAAVAGGGDDPKYALVHGCFALRAASGQFVAKDGAGGYAATANDVAGAEPFRMQATDLGRYMLYGKAGDFLAADGEGAVSTITTPGPAADFATQDATPNVYTLTPASAARVVATGAGGKLVLADPASAGDAAHFTFVAAQGCAIFPEAELNATGTPGKGASPFAETHGFIDAHMHMMGFEFLGGDLHCGRPWSPYGVTVALAGCPRDEPASPVIEGFLMSDPARPAKDPVGWPTFNEWPRYNTLAHEQSYYRWLERAWLGGERIFVNLFVENHALCSLYPHRRNSCNEMDSVRLQAKDLRLLERYIDAQEGGPGKGWFRIVADPFQARRVINAGKLAVVPGIEVSSLFDCGLHNGVSDCTDADVDKRLDAVYSDLGVRDMELINKFDNGFAGVAGDNGTTGIVVNTGNFTETGKFWDMHTCTGPEEESDHEQLTLPGTARDVLVGALLEKLLPGGTLPAYPAPPHCNSRGLTALGDHLVRRMIDKRMIVDPDHLDVISRKQLLSIVEAARYSGVVSSHSWSTTDAYPRILKLGGVVTPYAGASTTFAEAWKRLRAIQDPRFLRSIGWGADMNGFGAQGPPRKGDNPVTYPFKSFDGRVTFERQRTGTRVFDINDVGVAHYGLYPDWIQDLRNIAGDAIVNDLSHGSEAYLEMWERAIGIAPRYRCRDHALRFRSDGLGSVALGVSAEDELRSAGQPLTRVGRTFTYCAGKQSARAAKVRVVFGRKGLAELITSTSQRHRWHGLAKGSRAGGEGLHVESAGAGARAVYRVRGGRVRWMAIASKRLAGDGAQLRRALKQARLS
ncbi:MAG: hypothetical protein QOH62_127 [Solirubrobacteraceae bacterium]|jgi:hypothetical protein|nr:hypothetical protein [Solirubrobacteraceae bacterium]